MHMMSQLAFYINISWLFHIVSYVFVATSVYKNGKFDTTLSSNGQVLLKMFSFFFKLD